MSIRLSTFLAAVSICWLPAQAGFAADAWHSDEFDYTTQVFPGPTFNSMSGAIPETIRTVAVLPVDLSVAASLIPNLDTAAARIEAQAAERLTAAGYKVIPADEMRKIVAEVRASVGDLYDTRTGRPYPDRIRDRTKRIWETHQSRHNPDAFLLMSAVLRKAEVNHFKARWDGIDENVSGRGALADFWTGPAQQFAAIPGLSLGVWLVKPDKILVYGGTGGLHLIAYIRQSGGHPDYLEVGPSEAVVADTRIARALDVALSPAFEKRSAAPEKKAPEKKAKGRTKPAVSYPQAPVAGGPAPGAPPFLTAVEFKAKYKKIALTPVTLPNTPGRRELQARYEAILKRQLEAAGFEVVGSDAFLKFFEQEAAAATAFFNGQTGRVNQETFNAIRTRAFELQRQECQCDAILLGSVATRPALFSGPEAHWLGASQIITGDSTSLLAKLNSRGNKVGTIPASIFHVMVFDPASVVLYEGVGGLEVQSHLDEKGFTAIPPDKLYVDAARNETAVALALTDLITVKQPQKK
jgi:hypothetical protein